jgi:DNA-binding response OmpR family regulator
MTRENPNLSPPLDGRPRKIALVADDEPIVGATLVEILQTEGYDALYVSNGESALFWAKIARPDYLIADIVMPRMNGIELAKAVLAFDSRIRIILFSGNIGSPALINQAKQEGWSFELLPKPIKPEELLARMRSA